MAAGCHQPLWARCATTARRDPLAATRPTDVAVVPSQALCPRCFGPWWQGSSRGPFAFRHGWCYPRPPLLISICGDIDSARSLDRADHLYDTFRPVSASLAPGSFLESSTDQLSLIRGIVFVFSSVFGYLADTYRPVAASAMASNAFLRCILSSGFPLVRCYREAHCQSSTNQSQLVLFLQFSNQMYAKLGTVGAGCVLGGITTILAYVPASPGALLPANANLDSFPLDRYPLSSSASVQSCASGRSIREARCDHSIRLNLVNRIASRT